MTNQEVAGILRICAQHGFKCEACPIYQSGRLRPQACFDVLNEAAAKLDPDGENEKKG